MRNLILFSIIFSMLIAASMTEKAERTEASTMQSVRLVSLDPRFDRLAPRDTSIEKIADGFNWVEGPVWDRKKGYLLFSDIPANSIYKWEKGKEASLFLKPSGYTGTAPFEGREPGSNGLLFDTSGRLVLCEHGDRRIARLESNGKKTTLADRYEGKRFNSPNDATYKSNGDLYFTDPPFGLPKISDDPRRELDFCGVYRLSKDGKVTLLTKEVSLPNGIAFSPDEKTLYVTDVDSQSSAWLAFDVKADGTITNRRVFVDARPFSTKFPGAPDGLKVDRDGNLFASGPGGIYVFAPDGKHLGTIETGGRVSNCGWGDDGSVLYITADKAVYRVKLNTKGMRF